MINQSLRNASCAFLLFLLCLSVKAQILNIEKSRLDSINPEKPYGFNFTTQLKVYNRSASENEQSEFVSFSNELNAIYAPGKHTYTLLGNLSYAENNRSNILNNGYAHARSNLHYRHKWSQEIYAQIQYDRFRGLTDRYLLGGAIRWRAIQATKFELFIASGPMYEYERWKNTFAGDESPTAIEKYLTKLSTYVILRWDMNDKASFNNVLYYQVGYDKAIEAARNRMSYNGNLNFQISRFLSFTLSISMAYEDKPIIPITKFIYTVQNGLSLTF